MNAWPLPFSRLRILISFFVLSILPVGCGAVGPPIPPEDVGIEAKIRQQQQQDIAIDQDAALEDPATVLEEETVELPALYPIGTR